MPSLSRRDLLALAAASPLLCRATAHDGSPADLDDVDATLSRFPRTQFQRTLRQTRDNIARADARFAAADSREKAAAFVAECREQARACLLLRDLVPPDGPPPVESVGTLERPTFTVEKIVYDSLPGYRVSALLYKPTNATGPLPAVVGLCGHAMPGKAYEPYQQFAQLLAMHGFACLVLDPIGQGERLLDPVRKDGVWKSQFGGSTTQHIEIGNRLGLTGNFFGGLRLLDAIRAIDLLATRDDIDPDRIGVTGNSGGGTMTTWLTAADERVAFSAPSCFVTSFLANLENELPADSEQCPPGCLAAGLDHAGFLAANAPKPLLIIAQRDDFFDVRGTRKAFGQLRDLYRQFGAEDAVDLHVGPGTHGFHQDAREAMVAFFRRAAGLGGGPVSEPELELFDPPELSCFPEGQAEPAGSRSPLGLVEDAVAAAADGTTDLFARMVEPTGITGDPLPAVRVLRGVYGAKPRPHLSRYLLVGSTGVRSLVYRAGEEPLRAVPTQPLGKVPKAAVLYVSDASSHRELGEAATLQTLIELADAAQSAMPVGGPPGLAEVYAIDVPGIGEMQPRLANAGSIDDIYGSDYLLAAYGEMNDHPMCFDRTRAIREAEAWLQSIGLSVTIVHGSDLRLDPPAVAPRIDFIERSIRSRADYEQIARSTTPKTLPPLSRLPFGLLRGW